MQHDKVTQAELDKISAHLRQQLGFSKLSLRDSDLTARMEGIAGEEVVITLTDKAMRRLGGPAIYEKVPRAIGTLGVAYSGQPKALSLGVEFTIKDNLEYLVTQAEQHANKR